MRRSRRKLNMRGVLGAALVLPCCLLAVLPAYARVLRDQKTEHSQIVDLTPAVPYDGQILVEQGQDILLEDWPVSQETMTFHFPAPAGELSVTAEPAELVTAQVVAADGAATVTVTYSPESTEPDVTEPETTEPDATEPDVTEPDVTEPETTDPMTRSAEPPTQTQSEETQPEETQPEETQPEETQPEETQPEETQPEITERIPVTVTVTCGTLKATFHTALVPEQTGEQPAVEPDQEPAGNPVIASQTLALQGQPYWLQLNPLEGVTYTLSVSTNGALLNHVRYSTDGGASYQLVLGSREFSIPAQSQLLLLDFSYANLPVGTLVNIGVQGSNDWSTAVDTTVTALANWGNCLMTAQQPISIQLPEPHTALWSISRLVRDEAGGTYWEPAPATEFAAAAVDTQLQIAFASGQEPQAGSYQLTISHLVGDQQILWYEVPFFIQYPMF